MERKMDDAVCFCSSCRQGIYENEDVFIDDGLPVCETCIRESIGYRPAGDGTNYSLREVCDALTIERLPAPLYASRHVNDFQPEVIDFDA